MYRIIILILVVFSFNSCVTRYTSKSDHHNILIDFQSNNRDIEISDISIVSGKVSTQNGYYAVEFEGVRGGGKRILGHTIKDVNGDTYRGRLAVKCSVLKSIDFSVEEILNWKQNINNDTIYIAPNLCKE